VIVRDSLAVAKGYGIYGYANLQEEASIIYRPRDPTPLFGHLFIDKIKTREIPPKDPGRLCRGEKGEGRTPGSP
jgi:hypothetical protein